ncbi:hypothetical protein B0J14DRAFT_202146 [Halenospora varia]|nr:hypothetical protein B0J14DRAFT_202146 [Halenospora varia]
MDQSSNGAAQSRGLPPRTRKACVKCRGLKMKCIFDQSSSCRRCLRNNIPCIVKPRANASANHEAIPIEVGTAPQSWTNENLQSILNRLNAIENVLQLNSDGVESPFDDQIVGHSEEPEDAALIGLWNAVAELKKITRLKSSNVWSRATIKQLWDDFHINMPGLHFLPSKQTFSAPTPLLLSSMLYVSAVRHNSPDLAILSSDYFVVMCDAIANLSIPLAPEADSQKRSSTEIEEAAFQNVLGIILAGLTCEASIKTVGIWISIGYRLVLESCPKEVNERSREWQRLFAGLQILDLEHASLHMSCPIIPVQAPLSRLRISQEDDIYSLTQMMHTGLTHFTGRDLPTIWSCFSAPGEWPLLTTPFTAVDGAVIRDWATQLDRWLARFNTPSRRTTSEHERMLIFRQYILHRLLVLSIYHPARGFNLFSSSTTSSERYELLVSARAALKMQRDDKSIWSNWDFVMVTWAALLVLQGVEGGVGEPDDFPLVQDLLNTLRAPHQPETYFRNQIANQLEASFQNISSPIEQNGYVAINDQDHLTWSIFDEMSLQFADPGQWPLGTEM